MNWSAYGITEEEVRLIAPDQVAMSPQAIVLMKIAKAVYDKRTAALIRGEIGPDTAVPVKDFRYALGECSLARVLLDAPQAAGQWIKET